MTSTEPYCAGCKHAPCLYPVQKIDLRKITYRWFAPEFYNRPKLGWVHAVLRRYAQRQEMLAENTPPFPSAMHHRYGAFLEVAESVWAIGLANPLIVAPAPPQDPGRVASDIRPALGDVNLLQYVCIIGNQRLCVLRDLLTRGRIGPLVDCRVALESDALSDRCQPVINHPLKTVTMNAEQGWVVS